MRVSLCVRVVRVATHTCALRVCTWSHTLSRYEFVCPEIQRVHARAKSVATERSDCVGHRVHILGHAYQRET